MIVGVCPGYVIFEHPRVYEMMERWNAFDSVAFMELPEGRRAAELVVKLDHE